LLLLLEAYEYAAELNRDVWDFAVESASLRAAGMTKNSFRWLVCKGYVEHACERTRLGEDGRRFHSNGELVFPKRTCFVLTPAGEAVAQIVAQEERAAAQRNGQARRHAPGYANGSNGNGVLRPRLPAWDRDRHEFRFEGRLVKAFKLPSPNQETVLMAFEEEGWPPRIDDPLPPAPAIDPKRRLHDTIKSLNRKQRHRLVRFMGDGTGEGIRWEVIADGWDEPDETRGPRAR
jgi:hypothetical protein